jgi:hypothetical protein
MKQITYELAHLKSMGTWMAGQARHETGVEGKIQRGMKIKDWKSKCLIDA